MKLAIFVSLVILVSLFSFVSAQSEGPYCQDTDNGNNIFVKGDVSWRDEQGEFSNTDQCIDPGVVAENSRIQEFYCIGNEVETNVQACPNGGTCSDGACIESSTSYDYQTPEGAWTKTQETEFAPVDSCSVVEGGNPTTKTTVSAVSENEESTLTSTAEGNSLNYFSCATSEESVAVAWDVLACTYGASESGDSCRTEQTTECQEGYTKQPDGTCVAEQQSVCEDNDYGINYQVRGQVYINLDLVAVDLCSDGRLLENYCIGGTDNSKGNALGSEYVDCEAGFSCVDGACKAADASDYPKQTISEIKGPRPVSVEPAETPQEPAITTGYSFIDWIISIILRPFTVLQWLAPIGPPLTPEEEKAIYLTTQNGNYNFNTDKTTSEIITYAALNNRLSIVDGKPYAFNVLNENTAIFYDILSDDIYSLEQSGDTATIEKNGNLVTEISKDSNNELDNINDIFSLVLQKETTVIFPLIFETATIGNQEYTNSIESLQLLEATGFKKKLDEQKINVISGPVKCGQWCLFGGSCDQNSPWFTNSCRSCHKSPNDWFFGKCV